MKSKTYEGIFNQSGVIPFRKKRKNIEVLIITSRNGKKWIFPKGIIEPDMTSEDSAAKEAFEEAGVEGKVYPKPVGAYTFTKWGDRCRVQLFTMKVKKILDSWPEASFRERKWVSVEEAKKLVQPAGLRKVLNYFIEFIDSIDN